MVISLHLRLIVISRSLAACSKQAILRHAIDVSKRGLSVQLILLHYSLMPISASELFWASRVMCFRLWDSYKRIKIYGFRALYADIIREGDFSSSPLCVPFADKPYASASTAASISRYFFSFSGSSFFAASSQPVAGRNFPWLNFLMPAGSPKTAVRYLPSLTAAMRCFW